MANILIGVTGGIASYKAIDATSKLTQLGHNVRVVLTENTLQFVTPLAFQAIGRNHVYVDTFKEENPAEISHIKLGEWADIILILPATANTIGKLANGIYDNMLTNVLAANTKPVMIMPAMNVNMLHKHATQRNIETLKKDGYHFVDSETGFLACGYNADGRLAKIETVIEEMNRILSLNHDLKGKRVLITAGPTQERIDSVRYLTNYSSGKMGYALAEAFSNRGADVTLISGPVNLDVPSGVNILNVESTEEMFEAVKNNLNNDIGVFSAAVSDYTPKNVAHKKLKKDTDQLDIIELKETTDILKYVGHNTDNMYVVGFAAETDNVEENALKKLQKKNIDAICLNDVSNKAIGMNSDYNEITMYYKNGEHTKLNYGTKVDIAHSIINEIKKRVDE